jgi:hypothetical protein
VLRHLCRIDGVHIEFSFSGIASKGLSYLKRYIFVLILVAQLQGCVDRPQRPANVPPYAKEVGEVFIGCSVETSQQANRCTVYTASGGDVLESGLFVLSGAGREASREDLTFAAFDGTQILLADARTLYPVLLDEVPVVQRKLQTLVGSGTLNCGMVRATSKFVGASDCARNAFVNKKPFYVCYLSPRGDSLGSLLAEGIAGDSRGGAYEVRYQNSGIDLASTNPGAQVSDGGHVLARKCPKPVHLWKLPNEQLTCEPNRE